MGWCVSRAHTWRLMFDPNYADDPFPRCRKLGKYRQPPIGNRIFTNDLRSELNDQLASVLRWRVTSAPDCFGVSGFRFQRLLFRLLWCYAAAVFECTAVAICSL